MCGVARLRTVSPTRLSGKCLLARAWTTKIIILVLWWPVEPFVTTSAVSAIISFLFRAFFCPKPSTMAKYYMLVARKCRLLEFPLVPLFCGFNNLSLVRFWPFFVLLAIFVGTSASVIQWGQYNTTARTTTTTATGLVMRKKS